MEIRDELKDAEIDEDIQVSGGFGYNFMYIEDHKYLSFRT